MTQESRVRLCGLAPMDRITERLTAEIRARADVGLAKYGVSVADSHLSRLAWLQHFKEELLDAAVYVEKLIELERGDLSDPATIASGQVDA